MIEGTYRITVGGRFVCTPAWQDNQWQPQRISRLYFPQRGSAWIESDAGRTTLRPQHIYLIPGGGRYTHGCDREMVVDWLHFQVIGATLELAMLPLHEVIAWPAKDHAMWREVYRDLGRSLPDQDRPSAVSARLLAMVSYFASLAIDTARDSAPDPRNVELMERLAPAIQYMNHHDLDQPALDAVAEVVDLSPDYFHRLFVQAYGKTPYAYMLERRMNQALSLLTSTNQRIADVGEACGYDNPFYFSRTFKKHFGISPRAARQGRIEP
ncbi:helix-turn-helix transcriptional regulator [Algisphaera agarilytica]|uniref:AraC-like DNA-binding protein n=1 Tax=Algisphaera agarilytica TaxID=1385975 RepID=A0A7X0H9R9_9BACT|nr:AraC family transcriptional regulator [Algisphaera agarilytica]MBB6430776.1 AraC-like DNA-binding protein [Algisphaera agarilytica]